MGQYYKPISIEKNEYLHSHDYDNGLKLMEHSWIGNDFVSAVENLIKRGGAWFGTHIVWAGDYADAEINSNGEPMKTDEGYDINLYAIAREKGTKLTPEISIDKSLRYLKNMDTNEFVDLRKVPVTDIHNNYEFKIHPLPLLTCEGNGRGSGDYHKESNLIGKWARNRVTIQKSKPKHCTELIFDLVE